MSRYVCGNVEEFNEAISDRMDQAHAFLRDFAGSDRVPETGYQHVWKQSHHCLLPDCYGSDITQPFLRLANDGVFISTTFGGQDPS